MLVLRRFEKIYWELDPDMELEANDVLTLFGRHDKNQEVAGYFSG